MDKIFISSTYSDLIDHREELIKSLIKIKRSFEAMEYFGSSPNEPVSHCKQIIKKCNYFVLIIGMRYGSVDKSGKSITEIEYDEARKLGLKIYGYIINEQEHPILPIHIDLGPSASKLQAFKNRVMKDITCQLFSSPKDLVNKVITDYINSLEDHTKDSIIVKNESNFRKLISDVGISSFEEKSSLDISELFETEKFDEIILNNIDMESLLAAAFLAMKIKDGELNVLKHFISFKPAVWKALSFFLGQQEINENALKQKITMCNDSLELRLLISIAGIAKATKCADIICIRLFDPVNHNRIISQYNITITPFYDVAKEALSKMGNKIIPVLEKHTTIAKDKKRWQIKKLLEGALKIINK